MDDDDNDKVLSENRMELRAKWVLTTSCSDVVEAWGCDRRDRPSEGSSRAVDG